VTRVEKLAPVKQADVIDLALARAKGLSERLSVGDKSLLARAWSVPLDVETLDADLHQILWLVHYNLLGLWVDNADRVWIRTTAIGRDVTRGLP
jgi:hypothetical protein